MLEFQLQIADRAANHAELEQASVEGGLAADRRKQPEGCFLDLIDRCNDSSPASFGIGCEPWLYFIARTILTSESEL